MSYSLKWEHVVLMHLVMHNALPPKTCPPATTAHTPASQSLEYMPTVYIERVNVILKRNFRNVN